MIQSDNGHRIRAVDKFGFRVKDNWYLIAPLFIVGWALVSDHFAIDVQAGEIRNLKEIVREQSREQSRNQREINAKLTTQVGTNERIEATQKAIVKQLDQLLKLANQ